MNVALITNVSALPRAESATPRCTSNALQTIAQPLPVPETSRHAAATQMLGLAPVPANPTVIAARLTPYVRAVPRRASTVVLAKLPSTSPAPIAL